MKKIISTDKAPAAIGPYSQAVEVNGLVFTSGVIPIIPAVSYTHLTLPTILLV